MYTGRRQETKRVHDAVRNVRKGSSFVELMKEEWETWNVSRQLASWFVGAYLSYIYIYMILFQCQRSVRIIMNPLMRTFSEFKYDFWTNDIYLVAAENDAILVLEGVQCSHLIDLLANQKRFIYLIKHATLNRKSFQVWCNDNAKYSFSLRSEQE